MLEGRSRSLCIKIAKSLILQHDERVILGILRKKQEQILCQKTILGFFVIFVREKSNETSLKIIRFIQKRHLAYLTECI